MQPSPKKYSPSMSYSTPRDQFLHQGGDNLVYSDKESYSFTPIRPQTTPKTPGSNKETAQRIAGIWAAASSVFTEHILSHPFVVLRRQCQVHRTAEWYHLTPFSLVPVMVNLQRNQSITVLFKGISSVLLAKGIGVVSETTISEMTPLPREVTRHSSLKKHLQHILLKGITVLALTPLYASCLVETVQSEIASERPGVLDCLKEAASRVLGWNYSHTTRLLPVYKLVLPTVIHGVIHYVITSLAFYTVKVSFKAERMDAEDHSGDESQLGEDKFMETLYPDLVANFTGNLLADVLLYPLETVLNRLFLQGTRTIIDNTDNGLEVIPIITHYQGALDCLREIVTTEGVAGLYKGFGALFLQYGFHVALIKLTRFAVEFIALQTKGASPHLLASEYQELRARGDIPGAPSTIAPTHGRRIDFEQSYST